MKKTDARSTINDSESAIMHLSTKSKFSGNLSNIDEVSTPNYNSYEPNNETTP
ncbi:MAG: hypothetical protein ACMG6E_08335 [Candidatus Roizmanbacteria bacterium]